MNTAPEIAQPYAEIDLARLFLRICSAVNPLPHTLQRQ